MTVGFCIWMFITSIRFSNCSNNTKFATRHHHQIINQKLEAILPFHFLYHFRSGNCSNINIFYHLFIFQNERYYLSALDNCVQWPCVQIIIIKSIIPFSTLYLFCILAVYCSRCTFSAFICGLSKWIKWKINHFQIFKWWKSLYDVVLQPIKTETPVFIKTRSWLNIEHQLKMSETKWASYCFVLCSCELNRDVVQCSVFKFCKHLEWMETNIIKSSASIQSCFVRDLHYLKWSYSQQQSLALLKCN